MNGPSFDKPGVKPDSPAPAPASGRWPVLPFVLGNAAAAIGALAAFARGADGLFGSSRAEERAFWIVADTAFVSALGHVAVFLMIRPFAGPGPQGPAILRCIAAVMHAAWVLVIAAVPMTLMTVAAGEYWADQSSHWMPDPDDDGAAEMRTHNGLLVAVGEYAAAFLFPAAFGVAAGTGFFRRLPMWSGHSASRRLLAASAMAGGLLAGAGLAAWLLLLGVLLMMSKFGPDAEGLAKAAFFCFVAVLTAIPIGYGLTVAGTAASAWLTWLGGHVFSTRPCPLAWVGRVTAYHSAVAVLPFALSITGWFVGLTLLTVFLEKIQSPWQERELLLLSAIVISGVHALWLTAAFHIRTARSLVAVRFATA